MNHRRGLEGAERGLAEGLIGERVAGGFGRPHRRAVRRRRRQEKVLTRFGYELQGHLRHRGGGAGSGDDLAFEVLRNEESAGCRRGLIEDPEFLVREQLLHRNVGREDIAPEQRLPIVGPVVAVIAFACSDPEFLQRRAALDARNDAGRHAASPGPYSQRSSSDSWTRTAVPL